MTDQELSAIEARLNHATPGPWQYVYGYGCLDNAGRETMHGSYVVTETSMEPYPGLRDEIRERLKGSQRMIAGIDTLEFDDDDRKAGSADGRFIAAAPRDVRALLDEVRRLRALLEK